MQGLQKLNFFQNFPKFLLFLREIGQKLIYSPELTRRDPIFLKLFVVHRVFWDISLILAEACRKKFILFSGFDKICKIFTT